MSDFDPRPALTFDDISIIPGFSEVHPNQVELRTQVCRGSEMNMPILSAAMDTVTEEQMLEQRIRQERVAPKIEFSAPPKVEGQRPQPAVNRDAKVGRNDPCPCGSGKKYKKCHGAGVSVG